MTGQLELGFATEATRDEAADDRSSRGDGWVPSDEQAVVTRLATDLVVTAGAGSGKTSTLVGLYARALTDPHAFGLDADGFGPERILCLTFTERAAREIKDRIRSIIDDPDTLRQLEAAPVSTFHAFCASILRRYPLEAGVDPAFSVMREEVALELAYQAALETLRHGAREGDEAARTAIRLKGLAGAASLLVETVQAARTAGWTRTRPIERFETRLEEVQEMLAAVLPAAVTGTADELLTAARSADLTPRGTQYLKALEVAVADWGESPSRETAAALDAASAAPSRSWRFDQATPLRKAVRDAVGALDQARLELDHASDLGCWPALAVSVDAGFERLRRARAGLDYDDLLLSTRSLLHEQHAIRERLRERYRLVLVDEHQDTDPVQQEILALIVGAGTLAGESAEGAPRWCVVGDAKQAIYGFRGARVEAYKELSDLAAGRCALQILEANYRSRPELIAFYNDFFPQVLDVSENPSQIGYDAQVAYRAPAKRPVVDLLVHPPNDGSDRNAADLRRLEARALAARLRALTSGDGPHAIEIADPDSGDVRPARAGDVALLMRKMTDVEPYRQALQAVGLDHIVVGSGGFYGRQETFDCINALRSVVAPEDPIALTSFLRSPMVGLSDEALFRVTRSWDARSGTPLRSHVFAVDTSDLSSEMHGALAEARTILDELEHRVDREPPASTLAWLIDRTAYAAIVDALPDRAQRLANLDRLVAHAAQAPGDGVQTTSEWAMILRARVENPPRERDAPVADAGDRALVMSIHQSKGLQFPIVAIGDIGSGTGGRPNEVRFDPRYGVVAQLWNEETGKWQDTLTYRLAKEELRERENAEEARLFYVAATRARDHLVLSAGITGNLWLKHAHGFAGTPHPSVEVLDFDRWAERYGDTISSQPDLPGRGDPYIEPMNAAEGHYTAREIAQRIAGSRAPARPVTARARAAMREAKRLGVAGHAALESVPIEADFDIARWLRDNWTLEPEAVAVLEAFIEHRLSPRFRAARSVYREHPFRLRLDASAIVAGTIDCLIEENTGNWVVWDYKFGGAADDDRFHEAQLSVYALATASALDLDEVRGVLWYVTEDDRREFRWTRSDLREIEARVATIAGGPN